MEKTRLVYSIILISFLFPLYLTGQIDVQSLDTSKLTWHELELKRNWDAYFSQEGDWKAALDNKPYFFDCKNVFVVEYLVRNAKVGINEELDSAYTAFTHGCACGNSYLVQKGIESKIDINSTYAS